jgi:hypothetical protein
MKKRMKRPRPDARTNRILRLAKQAVLLPVTAIHAVIAAMAAMVLGMKSDKQVRAEDQTRQSRIRRQLRSLPPEHNSESPKPL